MILVVKKGFVMNRAFSILGVREDACKEEIKQAYERRLKKYKSDDYADDPEYVRKKIAELKEAYNIAYGGAPEHNGDARFERHVATRNRRHEEYEEERRRVARKADDDYEKPETYRAEKRANRKAAKKAAARHYEHRAESRTSKGQKSSGSIFDLGDMLNNPNGKGLASGNQKRIKSVTEGKENSKAVGIIILAFAIIPMFFGMLSDIGSDDDYYYDDDNYEISYDYITEDYDKNINNIAVEIKDIVDDSDFDYSQDYETGSDKAINDALDAFADTYFGDNSIHNAGELISYLENLYPDYFYYDEDASKEDLLYNIADFYGFPQYYQCSNMLYTNNNGDEDCINSDVEYLEYLVNYYRAL